MKKAVYEEVKKIIIQVNEVLSNIDINKETNLINDLGFESIMIMELIIKIEETFLFEFSDEEMEIEKIIIVGNLVETIEDKLVDLEKF